MSEVKTAWRRLAAAAAVLSAGVAQASARPEVSWSIMHPTAIDTAYMTRVAAKAAEYGGVDSFEVCGDCHRGYSGINGLSMLEKYPHAAAKVDRAAVEKTRRELKAICDIAHGIGKPLYYWHREIFIPDGLLEDLPSLLDEDGEFDLLGSAYRDWLRYKLDETFRHCPGLDGIVLTLTEADYSVIHNSKPDRYPPQKVVEELVGLFAEEHRKRGKRFILRSFGSNSQDYIDITGGASRAASRHAFEIETKVTEADFVPWLPENPFLRKNPPLTLGAECDALGEYLSAGYLPAAHVGRIREYVASARARGVDRYTIRIDRVGNSIFDSAHEVNLYAYMRFIADPAATEDGVLAEYAGKRFGAAASGMVPLLKDELEMIRNIHFVASNLVFHSFPLKADFKTVKAGGIFSVYRENSSLEATKDIWSILKGMRSPSHARILDEKRKGLEMAEAGLKKIESLKDRLPADEYRRQHRAFAAAVKAAKGLQAFAKCCVAYFEDMSAKQDDPVRLRRESDAAVELIESLMTDPFDDFTGRKAYFSIVGDNLDRAYFAGLRYYCRELLNEYACERRLRRTYEARTDVVDFVTVGGIYDDNRTIRTMHGAYTKTLPGRVARQAGNAVFPNGTISVRFRDVPGAKAEVALDPSGAQAYTLGESVTDGVRTVTVGKKGRGYPALLAIALVRPPAASAFAPIDLSFARGKWNPDDFEYVKSWRWSHFNRFEQIDDGIVNLSAPELTPEQVYRTCHTSSYVAMLHRRQIPLGSTVSTTTAWDYRMAPIIVLAPDVATGESGVPELRDHWEICLYDQGINVWYHYFEDGRQKWYKAADYLAPKDRLFKADTRHELIVKTGSYKGHRRMIVTCGDVTFAYVDDKLPETFRAGVIGCEGRNWFYDFKVVPPAKKK